LGSPSKIEGSRGGTVSYSDGRYWLIYGTGDGCFSVGDYSLIDLTTQKVTHVAESRSGCADGEENFGIDKRGRMLVASHKSPGSEWDGTVIYEYVAAIPLDNPSDIQGVIARQDMPKGIDSIEYLKASDQLLLMGDKKYLYDFSSKSLVETSKLFPTSTPYPPYPDYEQQMNKKISDLKLTGGYEMVLE
jgi:hypothetical protein